VKKTVIFVASSGRNVGKTSVSIWLVHHFLKEGKKVAFVKPVAQHYVEKGPHKISRDVILLSKIYNLMPDEKLHLLSPFVIESGFTKRYIKGEVKSPKGEIKKHFDLLLEEYDVLIVEGTGHPGVGSCINLSNAFVAKMLEATTLLVLEGGIGNTIDNYALAKGIFRSVGWRIDGVLINKVLKEKYDEIDVILRRYFRSEEVYYLGTIPFLKELSMPSLKLLVDILNAEIIQREELLKGKVGNTLIAINEPHIFMEEVENISEDTIVIVSGEREDILMTILALAPDLLSKLKALIVTSSRPHEKILKRFNNLPLPILYTQDNLFKVASMISNITVKIDPYETEKIETLKNLFEEYVDHNQFKRFTNLATRPIEKKSIFERSVNFFKYILGLFKK